MNDTNNIDARLKLVEFIADLLRRVDQMPTLDSRPADEILGYGDDGIPK